MGVVLTTGVFFKRKYKPEDKEDVKSLVMNLKKYYPTIESWWKVEIKNIEDGKDECIVAVVSDGSNEKIVGVGIFGFKDPNSVKLKTFYVEPEWQRSGIGSYLLGDIIDRCIEKKIKRVYVTFPEEEIDILIPFFQEYGFLFDGLSPFRYRDGVSEYVMGKIQVYDEIDVSKFKEFVKKYLFRLRGYKLEESDGHLCYRKIITTKESYNIYVKIVTDKNIDENKLLEVVNKESEKLGCTSIYIVSYYPLSINQPDIKVFDGYDLEIMFYPMTLKRSDLVGVVSPIKPKYRQRFLYDGKQMTLEIDKKSLRRDKVFFRCPDIYVHPTYELKRGDVFLFYETSPVQAIVGEGKIENVEIGEPEKIYEKYKDKGVATLSEIMGWSKQNKVMAIVMGKIIGYKNPIYWKEGEVTINDIIPNYEPVKTLPVSQEQLDRIRDLANK